MGWPQYVAGLIIVLNVFVHFLHDGEPRRYNFVRMLFIDAPFTLWILWMGGFFNPCICGE